MTSPKQVEDLVRYPGKAGRRVKNLHKVIEGVGDGKKKQLHPRGTCLSCAIVDGEQAGEIDAVREGLAGNGNKYSGQEDNRFPTKDLFQDRVRVHGTGSR